MDIEKIEADKIFEERILELTKDIESQTEPRAYILGGQPGSGKSAYAREILLKDNSFVFINGDDLREYHPNYYMYLRRDDKNAADLTQSVVNYWIEKLINHCFDKKLNIIVEGTMRNQSVPLKTIEVLLSAKYDVSVVVLAVPYDLSLASMNFRYTETKKLVGHARYSKKESHDEAYKNLPDSLKAILDQNLFEEFVIVERIGEEIYPKTFTKENKSEIESYFLSSRNREIKEIETPFIKANLPNKFLGKLGFA
jgi:UDP-N-acetylglucosamine kinase